MNNYWLNIIDRKKMFKEIDEIGVSVWTEEGTLGDFLDSLNQKQLDFLMKMPLIEFSADHDEERFGIEVVKS
jgi:hypothetical protein